MKTQKNENMTSGSIRLTPTMWNECDKRAEELGLRSRNEFIRDAIDFYMEWLDKPSSQKFLTPALESVIGAKVRDSEDRIARLLFKMAVELDMVMNVVAGTMKVKEETLKELRVTCIQNVKRTGGAVTFEDAVKYQRGK